MGSIIAKARQANRHTSARIKTLPSLRTELRVRRQEVIGSYISLSSLVYGPDGVQDTFATALADYLARLSGSFWPGSDCPSKDFFLRFYDLAIHMIAGGGVGNETVDDIIQLAECLARSKDIFIVVAKDLLPPNMIGDLFDFTDRYDEFFVARLEDAVLGAVSVFLGTLKEPEGLFATNGKEGDRHVCIVVKKHFLFLRCETRFG